MRIMHVCPSESFSGLEQYALEMALAQKKKGHRVWFLAAPKSELQTQAEQAGIDVLTFNAVSILEPLKFSLRNRDILRDRPVDMVHLHSTQEVFRFFEIKQLSRILGFKIKKIILQNHLWINHKKRDPLHQLFYSNLNEVWCSSQPARKSLINNLPIQSEKIRIINYGRNVGEIQKNFLNQSSARKSLGLPESGIIFGCVSRIEESKGIREFFQAGQKVMKDNHRIHLALIGGVSPQNVEATAYDMELKTRIAQMDQSLASRIHLLGPVANSNRYLKAFDLYILPSHQETFSLSLLDAQLARLPVVGSQSGGTPEVVINDKTGWLFKPKNVNSLIHALETALTQQRRWPELGQAASLRVQKDFDQDQVFDQILGLYEQI